MITGYFGLPGCGKSTFLTKLAKHYQRLGYRVFVLSEYPVDGCYLFDWNDLGKYDMSNSVILIDEITLKADSRDYKKFNDTLKQFFILARHYHVDICWFTQQFDGLDKKIRELTSCLYYIRSAGLFSYAVRIDRFIHIDKEQKEIKVGYKLSGLLRILFGWLNDSFKLCFRPKYYKFFDSFTAPDLPKKEFELYKVNNPSS